MSFYISTLAVYLVAYALGSWALNFQFGLAGIVNFSFIIFEAAGAYAASITALGRSGPALGLVYFWGTQLPFPLPLLFGAVAGGLLALVVGPATMRKMRRDYQAATMLVIAIIANQVVTNDQGLLNGAAGLAGIPQPLSQYVSANAYVWLYVAWAGLLGVAGYLFVQRIGRSPFGRTMRALRDDEDAAAAVGKNPWGTRMIVFVAGGVIGGLTGALLVEFISAWGPAGWGYQETFVLLVAVILGGLANQRGAFIGAFLVGIVLLQLPAFLPAIGYPGLIDSLQWIVIGVIWLAVLWFRPSGILPERPSLGLGGRRWSPLASSGTQIAAPRVVDQSADKVVSSL